MRIYPRSYADWEALGQSVLKGAANNKSEIEKFGLKIADLQKVLDEYIKTNAEQEKSKAVQQQATRDHNAAKQQLKKEAGKWVSVLEGQYGKNTEKLQEFGIAPRQPGGRKGPREPK